MNARLPNREGAQREHEMRKYGFVVWFCMLSWAGCATTRPDKPNLQPLTQHAFDGGSLDARQTACEGDDPRMCVLVGEQFEYGSKLNKIDFSVALRSYEAACERGVALGCARAGQLLNILRYSYDKAAAQLALYRKGCELGDAYVCALEVEAKAYHYKEKDALKQAQLRERAIAALSASCEAGDLMSCYNVANIPMLDASVRRERLQYACRGSYLPACVEQAKLESRDVEQADAARSRLKAYCDEGLAAGCWAFVRSFGSEDERLPHDERIKLYQWIVQLGNYFAYRELAFFYAAPLKDEHKAEFYYRAGCNAGDAMACWLAAQKLNMSGEDVTMERDFYARACERRVPRSCGKLATVYDSGRLGARDLAKALEYYRLACADDKRLAVSNSHACARGAELEAAQQGK